MIPELEAAEECSYILIALRALRQSFEVQVEILNYSQYFTFNAEYSFLAQRIRELDEIIKRREAQRDARNELKDIAIPQQQFV